MIVKVLLHDHSLILILNVDSYNKHLTPRAGRYLKPGDSERKDSRIFNFIILTKMLSTVGISIPLSACQMVQFSHKFYHKSENWTSGILVSGIQIPHCI